MPSWMSSAYKLVLSCFIDSQQFALVFIEFVVYYARSIFSSFLVKTNFIFSYFFFVKISIFFILDRSVSLPFQNYSRGNTGFKLPWNGICREFPFQVRLAILLNIDNVVSFHTHPLT